MAPPRIARHRHHVLPRPSAEWETRDSDPPWWRPADARDPCNPQRRPEQGRHTCHNTVKRWLGPCRGIVVSDIKALGQLFSGVELGVELPHTPRQDADRIPPLRTVSVVQREDVALVRGIVNVDIRGRRWPSRCTGQSRWDMPPDRQNFTVSPRRNNRACRIEVGRPNVGPNTWTWPRSGLEFSRL